MNSISVQWRNKGNYFYNKGTSPGLSPTLAIHNLKEAIKCYYKAVELAENDDESASAQKNHAMSSFKIAQCQDDNKQSLVQFYYKEAMEYFSKAEKTGKVTKNNDWMLGLQTMSLQCWMSIQNTVSQDDDSIKERIKMYETYTRNIVGDNNKATAYNELTNLFLHEAVKKVGVKDYKSALSLLSECYNPVCEGMRFADNETTKRELELLKEDVQVQTSVAEALQALDIADDLFLSIISEEEVLNIEMIWEIIDWNRRAIGLSNDVDVELEAIAHSRIGNIYEKVLKLKERARQYYTKCIELANTLVPRNIYQSDWYRLATERLQKFQEDDLLNEQEEKRKEREEIVDKLKDSLDEINLKFTNLGKADFLRYIYKSFPPKHSKNVLGTISEEPEYTELKKHYQKAVIHYHPDKIDASIHGKEWKVLSEEIVKVLTSRYEFFKGCDN